MSRSALLIDGKMAALRLREKLTAEIKAKNLTPGLAVILVGDDPASHVYVANKITACEKTGIKSFEYRLPASTSQAEVLNLVSGLNKDKAIHGILLQLPLPSHLNADEIIETIDPARDVDGLHPLNIGRLVSGHPYMIPCTPQGSLMLIKSVRDNLAGLHAVVIGRSLLFGKPMGQLLLAEDCTVTQCHSRTANLPEICRQADILVAAVGKPEMVRGDWIRPGAIVIDIGINRVDGKLTGDVAFGEALEIASAITPVPGGVGPMTIACLLANTVKAAKIKTFGNS